jgi:uncharacterized membrane protein YgcG
MNCWGGKMKYSNFSSNSCSLDNPTSNLCLASLSVTTTTTTQVIRFLLTFQAFHQIPHFPHFPTLIPSTIVIIPSFQTLLHARVLVLTRIIILIIPTRHPTLTNIYDKIILIWATFPRILMLVVVRRRGRRRRGESGGGGMGGGIGGGGVGVGVV